MFTTLSIIQWLLVGGSALTGFMLGRDFYRNKTEDIIELTIVSLIKQRMVKAKMIDGEYEIYKYDEEI